MSLQVFPTPDSPPEPSRDYDEVSPDASSMIESMRAHGYTLSSAIADLIDNSIAAGSSTVWLRFEWAGADSWVTIADDGTGMTEDELRAAMRLGSRHPLLERSMNDLGRFGLGLKTASLSQCRRLTVATRTVDGQAAVRRWDLDHLARADVSGWQLLRSAAPGSAPRLDLPDGIAHGTVVLWELMDRVVRPETGVNDGRMQRHFLEAMERVEAHLAMVFHRYLAGAGTRRLKLFLNGSPVRPWDPFLESEPATSPTPEEAITIPGSDHPILVRGFVLPHRDRLDAESFAAAGGPAGWNAQQGFYLYRNKRLIVAGGWLGLGGSRPWMKEEHYKLARIRVDIPNSTDHLWQLDIKKSSAQPPTMLRERLTGLASTVRNQARSVFAHRGRFGGRTSRDELIRPWRAVRQNGRTCYRIDRTHPMVSAFVASVPPSLSDELEAMLRIIEETVPIEQIWLDTSESSDGVTRPFENAASPQLRRIIEITYDALRRGRARTHEEAVSILSASEEFSTAEGHAVIATLEGRSVR